LRTSWSRRRRGAHTPQRPGEPIVDGLALADTRLILSGAIPAAVLALIIVDDALALVERRLRPAHLRTGANHIGLSNLGRL
jgi:hypothetical protein